MTTVIIEGYPHWNNEGETADASLITDSRTGTFEDSELAEMDIVTLTILNGIAQKRFKFTSDFNFRVEQAGSVSPDSDYTARLYISKNGGASWVKFHEEVITLSGLGGIKISSEAYDISADLNNVSDEGKDFLAKLTFQNVDGVMNDASQITFRTTTNRVYDTYGYALRELVEG